MNYLSQESRGNHPNPKPLPCLLSRLKLVVRFTYVAEQDRKILGFGELETNGHIDCFYVHYQHQNQGVGSKLYRALETKARELNLTRLYSEVSITAKPFFLSRGFTIVAPPTRIVSRRGVYQLSNGKRNY